MGYLYSVESGQAGTGPGTGPGTGTGKFVVSNRSFASGIFVFRGIGASQEPEQKDNAD